MAAKKRVARKTASSYETDIAAQRLRTGAAKERLKKAREKEMRRYLKIAKSVGIMDYQITDDEIREVFGKLVAKKSQHDENQRYSRNGKN